MDAAGIKPYEWQRAAAAKVEQGNLIVNVDTGCGKTLVAILAIDAFLQREPGRRCAFVVPTSHLLAHQQFERVRGEVLAPPDKRVVDPRRVVEVTGYTTGLWGEREWANCCERADVLVGTAEIFRRAFIDKGYLHLDDFSLIVVDECHHARGKSHVAELLLHLHSADGKRLAPSRKTRVLGLTASFASGGATEHEEFVCERRQLQDIMQAQVDACVGAPQREEPLYKPIAYPRPAKHDNNRLADLSQSLCAEFWDVLAQHGVQSKDIRKVTLQLATVLTELVRHAFLFALEHGVVSQIEGRIDNWKAMSVTIAKASALEAELADLRQGLAIAFESARQRLRMHQDCLPEVSGKVACLADELRRAFQENEGDPAFRGMVFVQEVALATPLAWSLRQHLGMQVVVASGVQSMRELDRNKAFASFRDGRCQLLVCTSCAEEGVDVSSCAFVARFSEFHTARSHVQGAGRARQPRAAVYYLENDPAFECTRASLMRDVAQDQSIIGPTSLVSAGDATYRAVVPGRHPYVIPETGAEVNFRNARGIFLEYAAKVTAGGASLQELFAGQDAASLPELGLIPGPLGGCRISSMEVERFFGSEDPTGVKPEDRMSYVVVLVLHAHGWLDRHNAVPRRVVKRTVWPLPQDQVPWLALRAAWFPAGILGEVPTASEEFRCSSGHRRDNMDGREHLSSGLEQEHLGMKLLSPEVIQNTQATVNRTFSNGGSVLKSMVDLVCERAGAAIEDYPAIRVSLQESSRTWHSADNRRLFMFKVVAPLLGLSAVEVDVINWTSEFDSKSNQVPRFGDVWTTDTASIDAVRDEVLQSLSGTGTNQRLESADGEALADADKARENAAEVLRCISALSSGPGLQRCAPTPPALAPLTLQYSATAEARGQLLSGTAAQQRVPLAASISMVSQALLHAMVGGAPQRSAMGDDEVEQSSGTGHIDRASMPSDSVLEVQRSYLEQEVVLERVAASLIHALGDQDLSSVPDAVSLLNVSVMGHQKPSGDSIDLVDVKYEDAATAEERFLGSYRNEVQVCGRRFLGPAVNRSSFPGSKKAAKEAKQQAALAAIRALISTTEIIDTGSGELAASEA